MNGKASRKGIHRQAQQSRVIATMHIVQTFRIDFNRHIHINKMRSTEKKKNSGTEIESNFKYGSWQMSTAIG